MAVSEPSSVFSRRFPSAFVTGGSSGLGRVLTGALTGEGVSVWAGSRSAARIKGLGADVRPVELDLSDRTAVSGFLEDPPWEEPPALLINNAGFGDFGPLGDLDPDQLSAQIAAMLESAMLLSRHVLAAPRGEHGRGVVNVSSLAVEFPLPFCHGYNAVKGGLSGFSKSLAMEFPGGGGPFVIDLRPGDFRTGFNRAICRGGAAESGALRDVWSALEHHLENGADPARIWPPVRRALLGGRSRTLRVGTFFQARVAPMLAKCLPESLMLWGHRRYYRMGGKN